MEAVRYKWVDMDYRTHQQAFLNFAVKAEKKSGKKSKPVYDKFKKFYDYDKAVKEISKKESKSERFAGIGKFFKKGE